MATSVTLTASEDVMLRRFYQNIERTPYGRQLTSYLLQLSKKYGVYGGADGGTNSGLAGVSYAPSSLSLTFDASDTKSQDQQPFFN